MTVHAIVLLIVYLCVCVCFVVKQRGERDSQNQAVLAKLKCAAGKETVHRPDFHRYSYQKAPVSDVDQSYGYRSVCCKAPQDSIFTVNATITSKHVGYTFLQLGNTYIHLCRDYSPQLGAGMVFS